MNRYDGLGWSLDVWIQNGSELEGLGFNLCVALPCIVVSLISEDGVGSEIGDSEVTLLLRQKLDKGDEEEDPSHWAARGLKRQLLREDYVEDKLIRTKEVYRSCTTYIAQSLYRKRTKDYPSLEGIMDV